MITNQGYTVNWSIFRFGKHWPGLLGAEVLDIRSEMVKIRSEMVKIRINVPKRASRHPFGPRLLPAVTLVVRDNEESIGHCKVGKDVYLAVIINKKKTLFRA